MAVITPFEFEDGVPFGESPAPPGWRSSRLPCRNSRVEPFRRMGTPRKSSGPIPVPVGSARRSWSPPRQPAEWPAPLPDGHVPGSWVPTRPRNPDTMLLSASVTVAPCARVMNNGCPPTDRNARTGLFTPPGIYFCARANNVFDVALFTVILSSGIASSCLYFVLSPSPRPSPSRGEGVVRQE